MKKTDYPLYLANEPLFTERQIEVIDKYNQQPFASVAAADAKLLERAIGQAECASNAIRRWPPYRRAAALEKVAATIRSRSEEFAEVLIAEAGKPMRDARGEVLRAIDTFAYAAGETIRIGGEMLQLQIASRSEGYRGMTQRIPVGPVGLISPFNFPLNLVAHKVAPAIAAGCPFILKPATATPISALMLGEILRDCELPNGSFSILPMSSSDATALVEDPRLKLLSFTGSPAVGWQLKARAGKKKVTLELGGNAGCVVDETADLDQAADRLVFGAFYQAGQSCISVQRIFLHRSIYDRMKEKLIERTQALRSGDLRDSNTFIGPLISNDAADRVEDWIEQATAAGARLLCGGERDGVIIKPALLENVPPDQPLSCEEAFGPVAILEDFERFEDAIDAVNASRFGLQVGIFTNDLTRALFAWDECEVGGVIIGDVPSWRIDHMPYGGVKDSGFGREGLRYAIEEMTEPRLLVVKG